MFYITDLLQIAEALAALGFCRDKQDAQGRWALEYGYSGRAWDDFGLLKQANKWVSLRALRALNV